MSIPDYFNGVDRTEMELLRVQRRSFRENLPVVILYLLLYPILTQLISHRYTQLGGTEWMPMVGLTIALVAYCGWKYAFFLIPIRLIIFYTYPGTQIDFSLNFLLAASVACIYALFGWIAERYFKVHEQINIRTLSRVLLLLLAGSFPASALVSILINPDGFLFSQTAIQRTLTSAIGIVAGILHVTPFFLVVVFPAIERIPEWQWNPTGLFTRVAAGFRKDTYKKTLLKALEYFLILLALVIALQPSISDKFSGNQGLIYFTFIPIIWIGLKYSPEATFSWVFFIDTLTLLRAVYTGIDPFGLYELQVLVIAISLVGYILAGVQNDRRATLARLQEEEDKYRSVIRQTTDGIVLIDLGGVILEWNKGMEVITQIPAPDAVGALWNEVRCLLSPEEHYPFLLELQEQDMIDLLKQQKEGVSVEPIEETFLLKDGTRKEVKLQVSTVRSESGFYVVLIVRDISDEFEIRRALSESEERFRGIVEWAHEGIGLFDAVGHVVEWNKGIERITAISRDEAINRSILELGQNLVVTHADGSPISFRNVDFQHVMESYLRETKSDVVNMITNQRGEKYYVKYHVFAIHTSKRKLLCVVASDITMLMTTELTLRKQGIVLSAVSKIAAELLETMDVEESLHSVLGMLGPAVDVDSVQLFHLVQSAPEQNAFSSIASWWKIPETSTKDPPEQPHQPAPEVDLTRWMDTLSKGGFVDSGAPDFPEKERSYLQECGIASILVVPILSSGECWGAILFIDLHHSRVWLDAEKDVLHNAVDIFGAALDKQEAERELLESRATAWTLLNAPQTGIVLLDQDGLMISVNAVAAEEAGMDQKEMIGKHWSSSFSGQEPVLHHEKNIQEVFRTGTSIHTEWSYQDRWIQSDYYPILSETSSVSSIAIFLRDVTESRLLQQEVEERNQELQSLNSIMSEVTHSLELPDILLILRESLQEHLDVFGGLILSGETTINDLNTDLGWGLADESYQEIWHLAESDWREWQQHAEPFLVATSESCELLKSSQLLQMYSIPLQTQGRLQGFVVVVVPQKKAEDQSRLLFYQSLSQQVGAAVYNARLLEEIRKSQVHLKELTGQIVRAREAERRRVARELHDEAGQALTALKIGLEILQSEENLNSDGARFRIEEAVELADSTMEQIRLLARDLRPPELEALGLNQTLENICEEFGHRTGLVTEYSGLELDDVGDEISINLYRFLQEALTNVARHAFATTIKVSLTRDDEKIILEVNDDGCGFDVQEVLEQAKQGKRMGLSGMGERLELIGGSMWITSIPAEGTRVVAEVPSRRVL
ncbi:MAG: PAS domain S-box protein [Anaerolineales bacterium]|nr:PAS domain S-box protein [Anaerolineales bacterium]